MGLVSKKRDKIAKGMREHGNEAFKDKDFKAALIFYNKALCYAETNQEISLAYANRSAVYMALKKYDECLLSIKWAREKGYENQQKLNDREEKCKKLMKEEVKDPKDDPWQYFKLSYPPHAQIPFIVDCLEMKKTKRYGRGIYTTRDLNVGDIIAIEPPITTRMFPPVDIEFIHCCNCLKACQANLIPCLKTASLMFCSEKCRKFIYKKFSDLTYVNLIGDLFNYEKFYADIVDKFGGHKNMLEFVQQNDIKKFDKTVFDYDLNDVNDPEYHLNLIMCMLSFKGSHELCAIPGLKGRAPPASVTKGNEHMYRFMAHAYSIMDLNAKCIAYGAIGTAFSNLFNHSCVPNVSRIQLDSKVLIYVLMPVKAGEQLFDSYYMEGEKAIYCLMDAETRLLMTTIFYNFKCKCDACVQGVLMSHLKASDWDEVGKLIRDAKKARKAKINERFQKCREQFDINKEVINRYQGNIRSMELATAIKNCIEMITEMAKMASFPFELKRSDSIWE